MLISLDVNKQLIVLPTLFFIDPNHPASSAEEKEESELWKEEFASDIVKLFSGRWKT